MIGVTLEPKMIAAELARSEMVSTSVIFQSLIRLSTISIAATAPATARAACMVVTPGPSRGSSRTSAISASTRGWM